MPGVRGEVEWRQYRPDGSLWTRGSAPNLFADAGRSAFVSFARGQQTSDSEIPVPGSVPDYIHFGTGTATPAPQWTSLQQFVTAKQVTARTTEANFTARLRVTLGATEMTGLITEVALCQLPWVTGLPWAIAQLSAQHPSGTTMDIIWRLAMEG